MITLSLKKLSLHLIWIFGLLEMITVPLVAWIPKVSSLETKSPWQGAVVGFLGIIVLFLILNRIIFNLKVYFNSELVTKISILPAAIWNMILLALIFGIQKIVGLVLINSWILRYLLAGFISVVGAVLITMFIYSIFYKYIAPLRISIITSGNKYSIKKISVFRIAFLAGGYEAIALPIILLWQKAEINVPMIAAFTGISGGIIGSSFIIFLYNNSKIPRLFFIFEK